MPARNPPGIPRRTPSVPAPEGTLVKRAVPRQRPGSAPGCRSFALRSEGLHAISVGQLGARVEDHLLPSLEAGEDLHPATIVLARLDPDQPDPVLGLELGDIEVCASPGERIPRDQRGPPAGEADL